MKATFPANAQAPGCARAFVRKALTSLTCAQTATLAVSELVANVVIHDPQSTEVMVSLMISDTSLRLEVSGNSNTPPAVSEPVDWPPSDATAGRGLLVVESLAKRWGVDASETPTVWCELDC